VIIDATRIGAQSLPETDVCVVGSGPAGTALADRLARHGRRVLVVESGPPVEQDWSRALNSGEDPDDVGFGFHAGRNRAVGGGNSLWGGQCVRLEDEDFTARPWIARSGWPISARDLDTFYVDAEEWYQVRGLPGAAELDARLDQGPAFRGSPDLTKLATVFARAKDQRDRLVQLCGGNPRVHLLHSATVTGIELDGGTVGRLTATVVDGPELEVRARSYVLATGGVDNPRLLLVADRAAGGGSRLDPHGLVGRFLQEHPSVFRGRVTGVPDARLQSEFGLRYAARHRYWPKLSLSTAAQERHGVLGATASLVTRFPADSGVEALKSLVGQARSRRFDRTTPRLVGHAVRDAGRLLPQFPRRVRGFAPASATRAATLVQVQLEQAPEPGNRVRLGERTDAVGMPLPVVELAIDDQMHRTLDVVAESLDVELRARRLGRLTGDLGGLVADDEQWAMAHHHAGTTRMSASARDGVVDADCRVHDVANLHLAGSSVFPTSGWANPTLTIVALAFRLADHLHGRLPR
jgi:choline dehydrogenase-like flavoprotein